MRTSTTAGVRRDEGMTLPELIISVTIMSFIIGAIGFALVVALKNTQQNEDQLSGGGGAQLLSAWFTSDVQSSNPALPPTTAATTTGCAAFDAGDNIVLLHRSDGGANIVSYRLVPDGAEYQIWRITCDGATGSRNILAFGIRDPLTVRMCDGSATCEPVGATPPLLDGSVEPTSLRLEAVVGIKAPTKVFVTGTPRTRAAAVAVAATPCALVSAVPQTVVVRSDGHLVANAVFDLATAGDCTAVAITVPTGATTLTPAVSGSGSAWTATIAAGAATWVPTGAAAPTVATVTSAGTPIGTFPLRVAAEPCSVASVSPSSVLFGPLGLDATLTISTSGPCGGVTVSLTPSDSGPPLTKTFTGGNGTWTTTITDADGTWTAGTKLLVVTSGGVDVGTLAFDAAPMPCTYVSATPTLVSTDSSNRLTGDVTMSVTTAGFCHTLTLGIDSGGAPDPFVSAPLTGGPLAWSGTVPRSGQTWSEGSHDAALLDDGSPLGAFTFTTREQCSMVGNNPTRVVLDATGRLAMRTTFSVRTRGDCTGVSLSIPTGGSPATLTRTLSGSTLWTGAVDPSSATWAVGTSTVTVTGTSSVAGATTLGTPSVTVLRPTCVVTSADSTIDVDSASNQVAHGERIRFTTTGPCGATLTVRLIPPGGTLQLVAATEQSPGSWRTPDLGDVAWTWRDVAQVTVFNSTTTYNDSTVAGSFLVTGR